MPALFERNLEKQLISEWLPAQGYAYRSDIQTPEALEANFREKFETLNQVRLTNGEFARLLSEIITPDVFAAACTLRQWNTLERDDGTPLHYTLADTQDWCKNSFEVVNQLRFPNQEEGSLKGSQRHDVTLLMNGLPVVQIELKAHGVDPRKAMEQIVSYKNAQGNCYGTSLLCFVQIFIAASPSHVYYFANNNRKHFHFDASDRYLPIYQWADEENKKITGLRDFTGSFLRKCELARMIGLYTVLIQTDKKLMIMRPYQIYAVRAIMDCIRQNNGHGYIWHTTGSGKTLTSFKAATLLKDDPNIKKCVFVVDRKDLDSQTRAEFNRFEPGCVDDSRGSVRTLAQALQSEDKKHKVIVTTIQKLGILLDSASRKTDRELLEPLHNERIAFIFDECHRSQFGENHRSIREFFPKAQMFGFTGTPIREENASTRHMESSGKAEFQTTDTLFEKCLHDYTIAHAIEDKNVLRFKVDHWGTRKNSPSGKPSVQRIVQTILQEHDSLTKDQHFNALFATNSISEAIEFYNVFKKEQTKRAKNDPNYKPLNIACVFSPPPGVDKTAESEGGQDLEQEKQDWQQAGAEKKSQALREIIADYNRQFGTSHRMEQFDAYYRDVQQRIKAQGEPEKEMPQARKIDIAIVVDMLLTGFDSKYLNTLYVDKNLKHHGLIQAFSRTNRILNGGKEFGNILDFRELQDRVDEAIDLFSGHSPDEKNRKSWLVAPAGEKIGEYEARVRALKDYFESQGLPPKPESVPNLKGDRAKQDFLEKFREVQRLKNQLNQYTGLTEDEKKQIEDALPKGDFLEFRISYLDIAKDLHSGENRETGEEGSTKPDGDGEGGEKQDYDPELELFSSRIIDHDYIMGRIAAMTGEPHETRKASEKEILKLIRQEARFLTDQETLEEFIKTLMDGKPHTPQEITKLYEDFVAQRHDRAFKQIAEEVGINQEKLLELVREIIQTGRLDAMLLDGLVDELGLGFRERAARCERLGRAVVRQLKIMQGDNSAGPIRGITHYD